MTVYTKIKINGNQILPENASPLLVYRKWQAYDNFNNLDTKKSRNNFYKNIISIVQNINSVNNNYKNWHQNYHNACKDIGCNINLAATTVWRMLVGGGTNPTMESGITLHHLYGFPYIPGSGLKGLLHHVAEMELMEGTNGIPAVPESLPDSPSEILKTSIQNAKLVWVLFGSLFIEQHIEKHKDKNDEMHGPECPKERLEKWMKLIDHHDKDILKHKDSHWFSVYNDLNLITDESGTGAMLSCYDAVPSNRMFFVNEKHILQIDILNPHYPNYYNKREYKDSAGKVNRIPPSDDQDPIPSTFLAVKPGAEFEFRFKLKEISKGEPRDDEKQRDDARKSIDLNNLPEKIRAWIMTGLTEWGVGGKTAAGYGYFDVSDNQVNQNVEAQVVPESPESFAELKLSRSLEPGIISTKFDEIIRDGSLEDNKKKACADHILLHYSEAVKTWRKGTKETQKKRIEWIEQWKTK